MGAYYDRLNVFAVEKSRVIVVDFSSANPQLAADIANAVADGYLTMQQSAKQQQTRAAGDWLAGEIEKMRKKVAAAEAKVEAYRQKSNLFLGANNTMLPNQQLSEINSQIAAARGKKADLEARARQLRALVRSGKPIDSSDIANSESMRRLIERRNALRSELAEQSTTLLSQHPRIKELKAQIAEANRQIRSEGERLARQLDNDAKVAGERLETLGASLDQVKKMASQTSEQDVELRALEGDAKTQRDLLESYLAKYREATARDSINAAPPEARIISRAVPALAPSYPKKTPMVLIAAVAGFLLSAGFTVTGALLAPMPARTAYGYGYAPAGYQNTGYVAPPVMPVMPRMTSPPLVPPVTAAPPPPMPPPPMPPVPVSTVEQVAANLRQSGDSGRRVAVIGTMRNVGTTFAAITLARALSKDSNVVLLDLAFGAPNVSVISTDPKAPGIAELIRGQASFGDIITRDQYSQVHLVATGDIAHDGPAFAASPMLATVMEALVRSYDHVVIDAGSAADTAIERLAPLAPRAVLVAGDPANPATRAARERLAIAGFADVSVVAGADEPAVA
jgi:Mrp family chromosome partitioning ATPase/capsular polysaccharide biosynthesis protein